MKKSDSRIAVTVVLIFALLLIALGFIAFTPRTKKFTNIYEDTRRGEADVIMSGDEHAHSYHAYASAFNCYIDCDDELAESDDPISLTVRPIGLRWYRTDMSGIFVKELTLVYEIVE